MGLGWVGKGPSRSTFHCFARFQIISTLAIATVRRRLRKRDDERSAIPYLLSYKEHPMAEVQAAAQDATAGQCEGAAAMVRVQIREAKGRRGKT